MEHTYDELIQDFYCQYQSGYTIYCKFRNCFSDFSDYQDLVSIIYLRFHQSPDIRYKFLTGQISCLGLRSEFGRAIQNGALDAWRYNKKWIKTPLDKIDHYLSFVSEDSGENILIAKEALEYLHEIFRSARLSEQEVAIYLDYFAMGTKQQEIGKKHGITERTVRNRLSSAQLKLKKVSRKI
jgi:RNA polymerase sigma factor (sigma-70 family)